MIGLLFLYHIGKFFSELAFDYDKKQLKFVVLGIGIYYLGVFAGSYIVGTATILFTDISLEDKGNNLALSLLSIPFGIAACYLLYQYLNKKWFAERELANEQADTN